MSDREFIKELVEIMKPGRLVKISPESVEVLCSNLTKALDIATRALDNLDECCEIADRSTNELIKLRADNERLRSALEGMMKHSCVAEADWDDKDAEDHAYESAALKALDAPHTCECEEGE